jgi:hypothetical protein
VICSRIEVAKLELGFEGVLMKSRCILIVSIVFGSSLIAFATAPDPATNAVLVRLDNAETRVTVIGVLENKLWMDADKISSTSKQLIRAGMQAVMLSPNGVLGKATVGGRFEADGAPCDWVRSTNISTTVKSPTFPTYALSAKWNPIPRAIQSLPLENAAYTKIMAAELKARKINAPVMMSQILKTDLDGDKIDEIILVAQRPKVTFNTDGRLEQQYETGVGDYSLLLVRKVVAGTVKTFTLAERVIRKAFDQKALENGTGPQMTVLTQYVTAIADIDGDGRMELFVDDYVHEGEGVTILGWNGKTFKTMLEWGCGV